MKIKLEISKKEIDLLKRQVSELQKEKILLFEGSLFEVWDNEEDEAWNDC